MLKAARVLAVSLLSFGVAVAASSASATPDDSKNSEWPLIGGNADAWQYSPLQQVDAGNVKNLGLAWMADIPSKAWRRQSVRFHDI